MHHKKIEYVDFSKALPSEIWLLVFSHLSPEDLLMIVLANTAFKIIARNNFLWEQKSYIHFPHLYNKDIAKPDIKWFFRFQKYYKDDYKKYDDSNSIPLAFKKKFFPDDTAVVIKKIFSLVKEGDLDRLKVYKIQPEDLDKDKEDTNGTTLIEWADKYKHQLILNHFFTLIKKQYLNIHNKFIPTKTDNNNRTILHWAIFCNQSEKIIRNLINGGCDLNAKVNDAAHRQAIHIACWVGKIEIVKLLLEKQPSLLNQLDNYGQTPILWAASRGHADIVDFLAALGADLNQASITNDSKNGYSALHWAAEGGHVATVQALLNYNASSLLVSSEDKTPDQVCKNIFIKNLISLDIFIRRLENNEDINKSGYIQFNLFNNATNIDVSATLDAAYVLKAVMLGNANKGMLDRYINELNRSELSSIFYNLSHYFPADTSVSFRPMLK